MLEFIIAFWFISLVATSYEQGEANPLTPEQIAEIAQAEQQQCEQGGYLDTIERVRKCR